MPSIEEPLTKAGAATGALLPGLRVAEIGDGLACGFAGHVLQALGASVIQIEPPGGSVTRQKAPFFTADDGSRESAVFHYLSVGKCSLVLDLQNPAGRGLADHVIANSNVVLLSGTSDGSSSQGLTPDELLKRFPSLIVARVSTFGDVGPYVRYRGGELQLQALGGLLNMIGESGHEPLRLGGNQAHYAAGLSVALGVVLADHRRARFGAGGEVTTSVLETVAYLEWKNAIHHQSDGTAVKRGADGPPMVLPCCDGFSAFYYRDGDWPTVKKLFDEPLLEAEIFSTPALRAANRPALEKVLSERSAQRSKFDLYLRGQELGIPVGFAATMTDLINSAQYAAREFLRPIEVGGAHALIPGPPWTVDGGRPPVVSSSSMTATPAGEEPTVVAH